MQLEIEPKARKFSSLYDNKRVEMERNHRVWAFPLAFFYRRTVFACITVYLFERPYLQIIVHQVTSLLTTIYLAWDDNKFKSRGVRFIEIATEVLLLLVCTLI